MIRVPLLHPVVARDLWSSVLNYLGIEQPELSNQIQFQDAATMRRGAISGLGVGLISRVDAMNDLRKGRLVAPLGVDVLENMPEEDIPGFYAELPRAHRRVGIINSFWEWVASENWDDIAEVD
jgi:LysR family glycine cleavage system transcriptional activator